MCAFLNETRAEPFAASLTDAVAMRVDVVSLALVGLTVMAAMSR